MIYAAKNAKLITMCRSDKNEPHKELRLGTVSNNITGGIKPVSRDPNPRPRSWYGSYMLFRICPVVSGNVF